jgi:hypothetical protein
MATHGKPGSGFPSISEYEDSTSDTCIYKFIKGVNMGKLCGVLNKENCKMCRKHVEASRGELREHIAKKGGVGSLLQKITASVQSDDSSDTTTSTSDTTTSMSSISSTGFSNISLADIPPSQALSPTPTYGKYPPIEIYDAEPFEAIRMNKCMYVKVAGINKGKRCDIYCPRYYKLCSTHSRSASFELRKHMDDEAERIAPAHVQIYRISGTPSIRLSHRISSIRQHHDEPTSLYASLILAYIQSAREESAQELTAIQAPQGPPPKPDDPISENQKSLEIDPENDECPICQDKLKVEPFSVKTCKVGGIHAIHNDCFVQWKKSCPQANCYVCNNSA